MISTWAPAIGAWHVWLRAAGRPQTTIRLRLYQIRRFAGEQSLGPWELTAQAMLDWLAGQDWSTESRRSYRSALRSFYGWGHAAGLIDHNPAGLLPPIRAAHHGPRPAPEQVIEQAARFASERVRLMIVLAAFQGLRRAEIARVHSDDLVQDLAGWSLRVHGKGDKRRLIPLLPDVALALRSRPAGYVFPGADEGHLSAPYVGKLVSRALGPGWTCHTLRHRFATRTYAGSRDLLAVQQLLGHSKPETTQAYVRLPDDAMRSALTHAA